MLAAVELIQNTPIKMISKQLRSKANEFLKCSKNADNLLDIVRLLENPSHIAPCLLTIELIFTELLKRREMYEEVVPLKPKDTSPNAQYRTWLRDCYIDTFDKVLRCLSNEKQSVSLQALSTAMKLVTWEGKYPIEPVEDVQYYYPVHRLKALIIALLSLESPCYQLMSRYQEFSAYTDTLYFTWKLLPSLTPKKSPNETFINNYLQLVKACPFPKEDDTVNMMCGVEGQPMLAYDPLAVRKALNKCWPCVMNWNHSPATHKQLLLVLLERVMPHLDKPLLLTDFLMDSLDLGGPGSLLALQGVFTMIQQHNLDYPNIYAKLYSMFEPEIFHTKYKSRLFYLADMFLSSSHLPEHLVAAFAKRLARLTLVAPPQDILVILYFIGNLMVRHPGLKRLISHPQGGQVQTDPYIMEERDPTKSFALDSSLWEISSLQSHVLPSIAQAARFIGQPMPSTEWDLSTVLDSNEDDIFEKELKKQAKEFSLTYDRPHSLALPKNERLTHYWKLF